MKKIQTQIFGKNIKIHISFDPINVYTSVKNEKNTNSNF
jgi:hypothetical protein